MNIVPLIEVEGIKPIKRTYVHLSDRNYAALVIGGRHGKAIIFRVRSGTCIVMDIRSIGPVKKIAS